MPRPREIICQSISHLKNHIRFASNNQIMAVSNHPGPVKQQEISKPDLTFSQIINMNVGFFGIQYSFALQQSAVNPIYDMLGADPHQIPILNLAGPMTGLLIQPLIGALSDKTWSPKYGRRRPYFLIGALLCSVCLLIYPFSSSLWMAAGLLWVLDAGNNTAMEPYRAFIADKLNPRQQSTGFQAQSFFTGFGQTLANISLFIFPLILVGSTGSLPNWVYASFFLGAVCSIGSIWWSMKTTPEIPPSPEEIELIEKYNEGKPSKLAQMAGVLGILTMPLWLGFLSMMVFQWQLNLGILGLIALLWMVGIYFFIKWQPKSMLGSFLKEWLAPFIEIIDAFGGMPKTMWQLALVYLFQWYALFCYWQNSSKSIALSVFGITPKTDPVLYEQAVSWTGLVNGWYNIVTFCTAFILVYFARKFGAKQVHFVCLLLAAVGFMTFPFIANKYLLFASITGFGIGWASMMGIPYLLVVREIPPERYGVYMGIINMMIVIPMILQTITFGPVLEFFLDNDPRQAIFMAGVLLLLAAGATLWIKSPKPKLSES